MSNPKKIPRRQQILSALAKMLHESPGERITTAALAKSVGVSEAALYRHFPSKTKMFEGLIEFIEETVFSCIAVILSEEKIPAVRCEKIFFAIIHFAEQNPGVSRLLMGDALTGETERLRQRIAQFFERVQTQLTTILEECIIPPVQKISLTPRTAANLLMVYLDGAIAHFVRSEFQHLPSEYCSEHWRAIAKSLFEITNPKK